LLLSNTGKRRPEEAILARSRGLLAELGRIEPPFSPEALAFLQGIRKITRADIPFDACLVPVEDGFHVELCKYHGKARQNFSITHEIAHTFLMEQEPSLRAPKREKGIGESSNYGVIEKLCDIAAAELLLPESLFAKDAWQCGPSLDSIVYLSARYGASLSATAWRFAEMGFWRCYFVVWELGERESSNSVSLRARALFRSQHASPISKSQVAVTSQSTTVHCALSKSGIVRGRDYMILGGEPQEYYVESMKLGRGDSGQVLSMVLLQPDAEYVASRRRGGRQYRLFV
jgi:hypothetical protein